MTFASRSSSALVAILLTLAGLAACAAEDDEPRPEPGAELLGGETTVYETNREAYTRPARNLTSELRDVFALGDHFFNRGWIIAPASAEGNDGLGPTYNATSCSACHLKDGRGSPPSETDKGLGLLYRLSIPGTGPHGGPNPEPSYGGQLNPFAILGIPAEGQMKITYEEKAGAFVDGEAYSLRVPHYEIQNLGFGPFAAGTMVSPRVAPIMIGLGLLEAIPEETLVAMSDENDADHDGVSGRPNRVWDVKKNGVSIGRFGWKANQPNIAQQTAGAFLGDIGITTTMFPEQECPAAQTACKAAPNGGSPELDDRKLDAVVDYNLTIGVPARRLVGDPVTSRGERLFTTAGCAACHKTKLETGEYPRIAAISRQTIRPFTDLLLHDMGPELADGRPDYLADGNEWRTPPLWGLGLLRTVSKHTLLLHDGRARDVKEAILWHGGEGTSAREAFRSMPKADRDALLAFLGSL